MTTVPVPFKQWLPDQPDFGNPGVIAAWNVLPANNAYHPLRKPALYADTTIAGLPLGAASGLDRLGNAKVFTGDASALYQLDPATDAWSNISRAGGYTTGERETWRFCEYGELQVASNYSDHLQVFDMNTSTQFEDLTELVQARFMCTLDNFLVVGNTYDALDGAVPHRLRWSAIGDPGTWTYAPETMSDFQDIVGYGNITGLVGGEDGIILLRDGIFRMTFTGGPEIFNIKPIVEGKGCSIPESVITVEGRTFFISEDGFYQYFNGQLQSISDGVCGRHFLEATSDVSNYSTMSVRSDPSNKLIYWLYASNNSTDGIPDRLIIYNYATNAWSEGESGGVMRLFHSMSLPTTMDELDVYGSLENVPASLDSLIWTGGKQYMAGLDTNGRIYALTGENRVGWLTTGDIPVAQLLVSSGDQNVRGDRARINGVRPLVQGDGDLQVRLGHRSTLQDYVLESAWTFPNVLGVCPQRIDARYHRITLRLSGPWKQVTGVEIDAVGTGSR